MQELRLTSSIRLVIGAGPPHIRLMTKETTKREETIDPEAIATRAVEFNQCRATAAQWDAKLSWPVAEIESDDRLGHLRKPQLANGISVTAACLPDPSENER